MELKKVVKVMNFQTLLKINDAIKKAEQYQNVGDEITKILTSIVYNKNLMLDDKVIDPDPNKPRLNIYIANDYGFCGNFNSSIRHQIKEDVNDYKIIIGKKISYEDDKTLLRIHKADFHKEMPKIEATIDEALQNLEYSAIYLYYNHYYSFSKFGFLRLQLFPVEFEGKFYEGEDYVYETNAAKMIKGLMSFYICYQIKMAEAISEASENVLRNQITNMALDKIDEQELIRLNDERKAKLQVIIRKNVENYKRIMEE